MTFANGGGLRTEGFRIDVAGPEVRPQEVARLFISSLNLLMVESVELGQPLPPARGRIRPGYAAPGVLRRAARSIPVVEHLTGLSQLPPTGFWLSAAPIPMAGAGTFPVRAYATIPE